MNLILLTWRCGISYVHHSHAHQSADTIYLPPRCDQRAAFGASAQPKMACLCAATTLTGCVACRPPKSQMPEIRPIRLSTLVCNIDLAVVSVSLSSPGHLTACVPALRTTMQAAHHCNRFVSIASFDPAFAIFACGNADDAKLSIVGCTRRLHCEE